MVYNPREDLGLISSREQFNVMPLYNRHRSHCWDMATHGVDDASKKTYYVLSLLSLYLYVSIMPDMDHIWYIIQEKTSD